MEVYSDGSGQRRERECCPPKNTVVENFQLTEKELKVLTSWIDESAIGPIHTEKSNGRMGERFGLFSVSTSTGDKIVIRSRDIQQLQSNQSEAAVKLLNWVNARANQKMQ
jgi:hypothetical protein